ncbi:MAG: polyprenyl synthetase family protein [Paludibacteraceae bacterium]|nr:polyprenyl synthetase family protein [Paludibacteraceae bacterium]
MATLTDIRRPIEAEWKQYERMIESALRADNKLQQEVLRYIGSRRGKQLRPLLVLLSAKLCNPVTDKTLRSAVALELLHTASLIHDDVVDSSDTRRGIAAVHTKWTNKVAVLIGDYMLAKVIGLVAEVRNIRILEIVSQLGKSLSSGEMVQLHVGQSMWIDEERYFQVIEQKTAQLFQACAEAGAESTGCTPRQRAALREYGRLLGLCFQIKDDIFDYSDLEEIGKPTMSDLRDGKVTLPLIEALRRAPQKEAERIRELGERISGLVVSGDDETRMLEEIKSFVMRFKGEEYAVQRMLAYKKQATESLNVFRDSEEKKSLIGLLDYAINRVQ